MTGQGRQDEAVILPVQHGEGEGQLVSRIIEGIIAHQAHLLEGLELHGGQQFLLMKHIFRGSHHFPKLPDFGGQFQLNGTAIFTVHEIFIFLGQTVQFISKQYILQENKKENYNDYADSGIHEYIGIDHICRNSTYLDL